MSKSPRPLPNALDAQAAVFALRLPLYVLALLLNATLVVGIGSVEGMWLLAALPFAAFCLTGWLAARDVGLLVVDLWRWVTVRPTRTQPDLEDAAFADRRYSRPPTRATCSVAPDGSSLPNPVVPQSLEVGLAAMPCAATVH